MLRRALPGILAAATLCISVPAAAKTIWNFNIWGPKRAFTAGIEKIKELAEADGAGEFEINIQYGGALGPDKQNPENIKSGAIDSGQLCAGYYPNKLPLLAGMELPFLVPGDLEARAKIELEVLAHPDVVAELESRWNQKFFGPAFLPSYEFMGNKRIASTDDMKGVKMRISGLNAKALEVFGAVPTNVTAPEGYEALRRGTIDSFGFPYTYAFGAYKLYEVSKFVTEGMAMSGFMCLQTVNLDAWKAAPQKVRDNMPRYQQAAIKAMIEAYAVADAKWRPVFDEKLEITPFPAAERAKLAAGAEAIWAEWAKEQDAEGRPGQKFLDFVKATVAKHSK
jgi:TRAP-type C4-dicarboxylate transport system substrate-binding protein